MTVLMVIGKRESERVRSDPIGSAHCRLITPVDGNDRRPNECSLAAGVFHHLPS